MSTKTYSVYFAGELFDTKHLLGNAALAEAIEKSSAGKYRCVLPQDFEQVPGASDATRNQALDAVIKCDISLLNFDGEAIDIGTVAEFMFAKFCDKPAVLLRTDFRAGGDGGPDPWNLMLSGYPRTAVVICDAMALYQGICKKQTGSVEAAKQLIAEVADKVTTALDEVVSTPATLPDDLREHVQSWLRLMPGGSFAT